MERDHKDEDVKNLAEQNAILDLSSPCSTQAVESNTSGVTLLGVPADVYAFGATYILTVFSVIVIGLATIYGFLPVFHELQLISTYEYLGLRFDTRTRKCSSFLFAVAIFAHLPIAIYVPCLALAAATGIHVHVLIQIICGICIFYTSMGGLKALVWIDTLQFTITFGIITFLIGVGMNNLGGISNFWNAEPVQTRTDIFNFSLDFTERDTALAVLIGFTINWLSHASINQGCIQKALSVPTFKKSIMVIILYCIGMAAIKTLCVIFGLVLSATYANCDPFVTKQIQRNDQLLPFYVLNAPKNIPGIPGMFIAGILSASLSTVSGNLNSVSGTIYEDFLRRRLARHGINNDGMVLKLLVIIMGILSALCVYVIENMGGILSLAIALGSLAHGPLLGMFTLGMFFPRANAKGAFFGALTAILSMSVMIGGNKVYLMGKLRHAHKPISVDECEFSVNTTVTSSLINNTLSDSGFDNFPLFRISHYWYAFFGTFICLTAGLVISYLTEENDPPVSKKYLSPIIHRFLSKERKEDEAMYKSVEEARMRLSLDTEEIDEELYKEKLRKMSYISEKFDP